MLVCECFSLFQVVDDLKDLHIFVLLNKVRYNLSKRQVNKAKFFRQRLSQSGLASFRVSHNKNPNQSLNILRDWSICLKKGGGFNDFLTLLFVFEVVDAVVVDEGVGSEILDEREWVEFAESALLDDEVVEEFRYAVSFNGQHVVLLPLLCAVF